MIDEKSRAAIEQIMLAQARSLGGLVRQFRSQISPALIDGPGWDRLLEHAQALPVSLGAFGFGFEVPLHLAEPRADLGVGLFQGSRSASHFMDWCRSNGGDLSTAAAVRLLDELGREGSDLRRIVGSRLLLEYDITPACLGPFPDPGLFLYPAADTLPGAGSGRQLDDLHVVTDALAAASGWERDVAARAHIGEVYRALAADAHIGGVGAFPSRDRAIRLNALGYRTTAAATEFLERVGWPGSQARVASTLSHFEDRGAFERIGVHVDVGSRGVGPTLGLSLYPGVQEWLLDIRHWTPLIDGVRDLRLAVPEKLSALADSSTGTDVMFGRSGQFMATRGIHHVKFSIAGDRIDQVKAYLFYLLFAIQPQAAKASG